MIGMWKAFEEMEALGWVRPGKRPKMIAVQASGCAPVARAYKAGESVSKFFEDAATFAAGCALAAFIPSFSRAIT